MGWHNRCIWEVSLCTVRAVAAGCYCLCFTRRSVHHCLSRGNNGSRLLPKSGPPAIEMIDVAVASMRDQSLAAVKMSIGAQTERLLGHRGFAGFRKKRFSNDNRGVMPPMRGVYRLFGELMRSSTRNDSNTGCDWGWLLKRPAFQSSHRRGKLTLPLRYHKNLGQAEARPQVQPLLEAWSWPHGPIAPRALSAELAKTCRIGQGAGA